MMVYSSMPVSIAKRASDTTLNTANIVEDYKYRTLFSKSLNGRKKWLPPEQFKIVSTAEDEMQID